MAEKIIYNKFVRDKISEIIETLGKAQETDILSDEACLQMLDKKFDDHYTKKGGDND